MGLMSSWRPSKDTLGTTINCAVYEGFVLYTHVNVRDVKWGRAVVSIGCTIYRCPLIEVSLSVVTDCNSKFVHQSA